jgi:hypothetical protein
MCFGCVSPNHEETNLHIHGNQKDMSPIEFHEITQWVGFIMGVLLAVIVMGEGQSFFVLMFQPISQRDKLVYHLNPVDHFDPLSIPALLTTGWTWGKKRLKRPPYFPDSWIAGFFVPLSGSISCILLVGVIGSFYMFVPCEIFKKAIEAGTAIGVANFIIPIPPLGLGRAICCPFKDSYKYQATVELAGAMVITALVLVEYWTKFPMLQYWVLSISSGIGKWILRL